MLKPLELTIYPLELTFPAGYKLPRDTRITYRSADRMAAEKRLTDAELAAEYWRAEADLGIGQTHARFGYFKKPEEAQWEADLLLHSLDEIEHRYETLRRFATLPHYDEEVTQ